jgi:GT2 family glycosyltransferase/SAM-dependent methyltransferase
MEINKLWKLRKAPFQLVDGNGFGYQLLRSFLWAFVSPAQRQQPMGLNNLRRRLSEITLLIDSGLFDRGWYLAQNPDVASAGIDPVVHYLKFGAAEGRDPNPLFNNNWYLAQYSDVAQAGLNPLVHYLKFGAAEGRDPNPLFDSDWYLVQYPDVAEAGVNPLVHYLKFGAAEGRDPNSLFDSDWYLSQYPDVAEAGLNPLAHFLKTGMAEGRQFNNLGSSSKSLFQSLLFSDKAAINEEVSAGIRFAETFRFSLVEESNQGLFLEAIADLSQRTPDLVVNSIAPAVSIIIPVYGQLAFTLNCLDSLCGHQSEYSVEIIVLDDASPQTTQTQLIAQIPWVRYERQGKNTGFTKNCNYGATLARGRYLVLLNSDARVVDGWLDEMLLTFKLFPKAGLVGSKLLNDDGSLQEAGGLFWNDGSAWNFGRGDDPNLPQYNYARRVDYCSGAALAIPKAIWQEVGGFDEIYAPAYCEDADLAFRLRERGYDTLYQPLSQVIHYDGKTHGRDITRGVKAYQVENLKKLRNRWQDKLKTHSAPGVEPGRAKDRFSKHRVLFLEHCTPTPDQDAGSLLDFNIMLLLRDMDFQVTFIPEDNFNYVKGYTENLQRYGIEVLHKPYITSVVQHLQASEDRYDLVFICRWRVSNRHIQSVRQYCPKAKVIFYPVDLHYVRLAREAKILDDPQKMAIAEAEKDQELEAVRTADASIVVSTFERELLKQEVPDENVHVWPLILDVIGTKNPYTQRQDIVFVGGYRHAPNVDAVKYFAEDVMPLLRPKLPGVRFFAVGSNPPEELQNLAAEDIIISGFVEDLNSLYDTMRVSVASLRFGAGIKGKVGTAMAAGLPVVATEIAVEGMELIPGKHILVANSPEDLAAAIIRVYSNETLWNQLSQAGVEFSEKSWGAEAAWSILNNILKDFDMGTERNGMPLTLYSSDQKNKRSSQNKSSKISKNTLRPAFVAKSKQEFKQGLDKLEISADKDIRDSLVNIIKTQTLSVDGLCVPCSQIVPLIVDISSGGKQLGHLWQPNWRERLECPFCHLNNRQRLMATLFKQTLEKFDEQNITIYFMEQVTPIFQWALKAYPQHAIIGSEYLGYEYPGGSVIKGIRHEDVTDLSFADNSLDLIISNDVFEHVPQPELAFKECCRVLKPGRPMLSTIPFWDDKDASVTRAKLDKGQIKYLLEPAYHGNPISPEGSLVFTDFGWDVLDCILSSGFSTVTVEVYASKTYGHLGNGQLVFRAVK